MENGSPIWGAGLVYHLSSFTCCYFGVSSTPEIFINQPMGIWDIYGNEFYTLWQFNIAIENGHL